MSPLLEHRQEQREAAERDFMKLWRLVWPKIAERNPGANELVVQQAAWTVYQAGMSKKP